jgi:hypothetical protein
VTGTTTGPTGPTGTTAPTSRSEGLDTLPPVDRFTYPSGADDVVVQIAVRAATGPDVPLLTVYGDGTVVAGTADGWRTGRLDDLQIQAFLDDTEAVGLLDRPLVLRGPDPAPTPDITVDLAVNGRVLRHELDLVRIERPPAIRAFLNTTTVENRFDLVEPFDPGRWVTCTVDGLCTLSATQQDAASRPVLRGEDPTVYLDGDG